MTGHLLAEPTGPGWPHYCAVPVSYPVPAIALRDSPEARITNLRDVGALWQCDCGQHWHCTQLSGNAWWWPISPRRARRILKRRR